MKKKEILKLALMGIALAGAVSSCQSSATSSDNSSNEQNGQPDMSNPPDMTAPPKNGSQGSSGY